MAKKNRKNKPYIPKKSAKVISAPGKNRPAIAASERKSSSLPPDTRTVPASPRIQINIDEELKSAVAFHQKGEFDQARLRYERVLNLRPDHPDALHLLGVTAHQTGEHDRAVELIEKAILINPGNPLYHYNKGIALKGNGKNDEAIEAYKGAIAVNPNYTESWFNMGNIYKELGKHDDALACYRKVLSINPRDIKACYNIGNTLKDQGKLDEALESYKRILDIQPEDPKAWYNMGTVFQMQGTPEKAFEYYEKALALEPDNPRAHNNVGNIYQSQGRLNEAINCYKKALELNPEYAIAWFNMGNVHQGRNDLDQALEAYDKADELKFDSIDLYINMGLACRAKGEMLRGATAMRRALEREPNHYRTLSSLVHQLQYMCEWDEIARLAPRLDEMTQKAIDNDSEITESPFESLTRHADPSRNFPVARRWAKDIGRSVGQLPRPFSDAEKAFADRKQSGRKLIVGYLSHDFCNHPVSHLMLSLFNLHDRDAVEIHCYSYGRDDKSYYRQEIQKRCDKFVDIREMGHADAARVIYENRVDILVDLMGYTKNNRLGICALRPAPVQVTWLGFPGGTGAEFIDYIITDRIITPPEHAPYYSEKFVYMPHSYILYDHAQPVSPKPFRRTHFNLPEEGVIFCSFNQPYKIEPVMFDAWMNILRRVPNSVLWTPKRYEPVMENLRNGAKARGVDPDRLIFADKVMDKGDHSARLRLADLGLDPRIYNGHATTLDALWAGVPVATLEGGHFPSRAASSFIHALGMPELVARTPEEYEELVVRLGNHPDQIRAVREKLVQNRRTEPLFDTFRFARNLERAFKAMWEQFVRGEAPAQMDVGDWGGVTPDQYHPAPLPPRLYDSPDAAKMPVPPLNVVSPGAAVPAQQTMSSAQAFQQAVHFHQTGQIAQAEVIYKKILEVQPNHADALHLFGVAAYQQGKHTEAEQSIQRAIQINPGNADYHSNLGVAYQAQGRMDMAVASFRKAVELKPEFADAYNNMGPALKNQGKYEEAAEAYQKAIELKPAYPEAYNNLGNVYQAQGRLKEAEDAFKKAIEFKADYHEAWYNMGNAVQSMGRLEDAIACFEKALEIRPDYSKAFSILSYRLKYVCAWEKAGQMTGQLDALTDKELAGGIKTAETPFINLTTHMDPERNFQVARSWAQSLEASADPRRKAEFSFENRKPKSKLVVGYLSNDFFDHPVAHQMAGLFGCHDRSRFEIYCYSYGMDDRSVYRQQIQQTCDRFVDLKNVSHLDAARQIYNDGVDVLIDLMGHTKDNRLDICAYRPAPVMVTYLGFPGTTGAKFFDYILTDRIITPESHAPYYSEKFAYMPHSYMVNNRNQPVSDRVFRREEFGLPEAGIIFCSFNQPYKIEPVMFDTWMAIMRDVPGSILWLARRSDTGDQNLRKEAEARGVSGDRLFFANKLPSKAEHLARLKMVDIALDTRIYNGHATTNDALWAGVPVVTLMGNHFASRAAAGFLNAVDMPELVAYTPKEYKHIAVQLATDPDALRAVKEKLDRNRLVSPLFDTARFARNLERAYTQMWQIYTAGEAPHQFYVREDAAAEIPARAEQAGEIRPVTVDLKMPDVQTVDIVPPPPVLNVQAELGEALKLHQAGKLDAADEIYQKILRVQPNHADTLHLSGVVAHQKGDQNRAAELIEKAVLHMPGSAPYHSNLGSVYHALGRYADAVSAYQKATGLKPDFVEAWYNMGLGYRIQGLSEQALASFRKAIELKPDHVEALFNTGLALQDMKQTDEALAVYQQVLQRQPGYVKAYNNMGTLLQGQGRMDEALTCYRKAVQLQPDYAEAFFNMGNTFKEQGELHQAASCFQKAIRLKPDRAEFYISVGNMYREQDRMDEAARFYRKSLDLKPGYPDALGSLFHCLQNICDWPKLSEIAPEIDRLNRQALEKGDVPVEVPFVHLTRNPDPAQNLEIARSWSGEVSRNVERLNLAFSFNGRKYPDSRLTVGYISHDFCNHPVSHLMSGLFGVHNRDEFRIHCYSHGVDDGSDYRKRIEQTCDRFVDIQRLNHADAARRIHEDGVDILVDLMGHTKGKRMEICALRPAPVQATWLGYPGSTGAKFLDYIIGDNIVLPPEHAPFYTEKFVRLPHCYMVTDHTQPVSASQWNRTDLGVSPDTFVFCSLNKAYKIEPVIFSLWMDILGQVPGSVLWLRTISKAGENNLRQAAQSRGIAPERLIFTEKVPSKADYLARLKVADLALDTMVYNGHATTSDALWAGVPVITLQGAHFASRAASSLLTAVGLPEMITRTPEEYRQLAVRMATHPDELKTVRQKLALNRLIEPLFDTPRFARNLEQAYREMWRIHKAGEQPRPIDIAEPGGGMSFFM